LFDNRVDETVCCVFTAQNLNLGGNNKKRLRAFVYIGQITTFSQHNAKSHGFKQNRQIFKNESAAL